jgi:hypothetical protein
MPSGEAKARVRVTTVRVVFDAERGKYAACALGLGHRRPPTADTAYLAVCKLASVMGIGPGFDVVSLGGNRSGDFDAYSIVEVYCP